MEKTGEGKKGGKKIMVVVDESDAAHHALLWVLENLKDVIGSSTLVIFAALPLSAMDFVFGPPLGFARPYCQGSAGPSLLHSVQEQNRKVMVGLLKKAQSICQSRGVKAETLLSEDYAGDRPGIAICSAAADRKIDLLILGYAAQTTLQRIFCSSVSDYCLEKAGCPVLVVKRTH